MWGTLHNTPYKDCFPNDLEAKDGLKLVLKAYFDDFRHAGGMLLFQRFWVSWGMSICVGRPTRVSYLLAAGWRWTSSL
ncbi:hypothetical protein, partial [uncultured Bifidobacterium sp.]|uniref:hypothetical protein n=1 Tax=uncultured Bifidobacterium sp. TaxID=165187 RepID=UPI00258FE294